MKCNIIPKDIPQKIGESIFRYKGFPYYCRDAGGNRLALYNLWNIQGEYVQMIDYQDKDFDFSSVPLGYVNVKDYVCVAYIMRTPVRKVKQGINNHNTKYYNLPGVKPCGGLNYVLFSKAFTDMVMDKYPSLEEAMTKLRKLQEPGGIAITRSIALSIDEQDIIKVYYKNQYVGWIQPGKFTVHVKGNDLGWVISKYLSHVLGWQID